MSYYHDRIRKSVKDIQMILVDDIYMSMDSAKAINEQLIFILALLKKEEEDNGNDS